MVFTLDVNFTLLGILVALVLFALAIFRLLIKIRRLDDVENALTDLTELFQSSHDGSDLVDRRLTQLLTQTSDDAATLRENVLERLDGLRLQLAQDMGNDHARSLELLGELRQQLTGLLTNNANTFEQRHATALNQLQESFLNNFQVQNTQLNDVLARNSQSLGERLESLSKMTDARMRQIAGEVDRRLSDGFDKTNATFSEIVKRLALIDAAQKKITELSGQVVNLQRILDDKRSRGAFGEVQLINLVKNILPESSYAIQYALPNERIADCVLFLPPPSGTLAIDAKFPLESYQRMVDAPAASSALRDAERQFKQDIRKHIKDISNRYILPGTTADGAMMFLPAEAVFAEIQARHRDLIDEAHNAHVWIVSPTTLWAILTTAASVLKDAATQEQVDVIQEHLTLLAKDFQRFRDRMDKLAKHIKQANDDVEQVQNSASKIANRFDKIEQVELDGLEEMSEQLQSGDKSPDEAGKLG